MNRPITNTSGQTAVTMADLIDLVLEDRDLTKPRRSNVSSAIRRFCAALGVDPDQAPAAFWFFREKIEGFHPTDADIKPHRWQTIKSDVAFALKRIGLAADQPKPKVPLSDDWTKLREHAWEAGFRWHFAALARYSSGRGIAPSAVTDDWVCSELPRVNE